jgi:hypothetical protein
MRLKRPREKDERHCDFIRSLRCVVCQDNTTVECAHIRFSDARVAKVNPGSHRPHDRWTLPVCGKHHREQHTMEERAFWIRYGIDPIFVALALYSVSGDHEAGEQIVACATHKFEAAA